MRKWLSVLLMFTMFVSLFSVSDVAKADVITKNLPDVKAGSYVIYDVDTSEVLFGKKYTEVEQPAQMAQVLTALLALEKGNLKDKVTVPKLPKDVEYANRLYLDAGEEVLLDSLVEGTIVYNATDAAYTIALHLGKTHEEFLKMMNDKAKEIGLSNTTFKSVYGYSKEQKTTALDMAKLASYAMKNEAYVKYANKSSMNWSSNLLSKNNIPNVNTFKKLLPEAVGLKYSDAQNGTYGFMAGASLEGRTIVGVILASSNRDGLADAMSDLIQLGIDGTKRQRVIQKDEALTTLNYEEGKIVPVLASEDFFTTIATNGSSEITYKTELTKVTLPIEKGETLGIATIYAGKEKISEMPLIAGESAKKNSSWLKVLLLCLALLLFLVLGYVYLQNQRRRPRKHVAPSRAKKSKGKLPKNKALKVLPPKKEDMSELLKNPSKGSEAGRQKLEERMAKKGK